MAITKVPTGWRVDVQPGGRRGAKRFRKIFPTKREAVQYQAVLLSRPAPGAESVDTRRLSDLVDLWHDLHGVNLKSAVDTKNRLLALCAAMGNPLALDFRVSTFADYRAVRIGSGVHPSTLNRERACLIAVFSELSRLGRWSGGNPLAALRPVRVDVPELSWLTLDQVRLLFEALRQSSNPDVLLVSRLSLATGARWSEARGLAFKDLRNGMVTFHRTKSGKSRSVPVDEALFEALSGRLRRGPFCSCYSAFRSALVRSGIQLPAGQMAHVLRHTFAAHFVQGGGDILTLQKILGHSSVQVTMRYAHLSPGFLEQAKRLNPLAALAVG